MEDMAEMCGQGEEGKQLAHDELELMKSGNMTAMESTMAHELAVYVEELCQVLRVLHSNSHVSCN